MDHRLRIVAEWVVDVILLQVGLKCFSMRMTFDPFDKLLNSEMFCSYHNFFFLETIRTSAMRVIHVIVKTEETQKLRMKFVLYRTT